MAGGSQPGANSRGRGGKFRKYTRGGGKHFSRDLKPLDAEGNEISMWSEDAQNKQSGSEEEESSEEESDEDEGGPPMSAAAEAAAAASREDRKKEKKARKDAAIARQKGRAVQVGDLPSSDESEEGDAPLPANPNHSRASRNQAAPVKKAAPAAEPTDAVADGLKALSVGGTPSRRERESMEAAQAKERYRRLHEQGKTDEAKADLARLKVIREKREAEAARRQAEKEVREAEEKSKREEIEAREAKKREAALGKPAKAKGKK